ncbi:MAG: hypothetical protein A2V83_09610 [Nitrospirae bacterium RBG_16_64_22]|nr:MAG: hypothetical protein A2V83_09610 [Nitrospirae bacterium RBG_16_64_22]
MARPARAGGSPGGTVQDLVEMGEFYYLNQKYAEAIKVLQKALSLDPRCVKAYYTLGVIHESKNEPDRAREMYEKALSIQPDFKPARDHFDRLVGM